MDNIKTTLRIIRKIEELSFNAWPSLQTIMFDGWVIRFANGYSKRANSINPTYDSTIDIEEKIRVCEQMYRGKNLPVVFKMTSAAHPENLAAILEQHGYHIDSRTSVQMLDLIDGSCFQEVELNGTFTEEWLDGLCRLNNISEETKPTIRQMLGNIVPRKCFAAIRLQGRGIAYGFSVLQNECAGFYDIVTDPSFRNQGCSKRLMSSLLAWGKQNNSQQAYLQVMLDNAPALHLYTRLGFQEAYQYWYRIKS